MRPVLREMSSFKNTVDTVRLNTHSYLSTMEPTRINNRSSQSLNVEEILKLISLQIATVEAEVKTLRIRSDGHQQAIEKHQKAIEDQQTEIVSFGVESCVHLLIILN